LHQLVDESPSSSPGPMMKSVRFELITDLNWDEVMFIQ
jgi:hypothetical protein